MVAVASNGLLSPAQTEKTPSVSSPPRIVLAGKTGRILCVSDIRGDYHELNKLIREHDATAVIHTGDFGFMNAESLDRMQDKILRHLLQYSPLIPNMTRSQLLAIPESAGRAALINALNNSSNHFLLSYFPLLLTGAITFPVPVFTVWGLLEDVRILEKFRTGEYEVHNLNIIDEATTSLLDIGGLKLRLFGLGGALIQHKLFNHGEGYSTIAGGEGTMWTTALQIGELVDTAQRVFDPSETRILIASAPVTRNGLLTLIANTLRVDITISGGLHFRYPVSLNQYSIHTDHEEYKRRLASARDSFQAVYNQVKGSIEASMNGTQQDLLKKALMATSRIVDDYNKDESWTNTWHWVLCDASCGHMILSVDQGRVTAETRSTGLNFSHRTNNDTAPRSGPIAPAAPAPIAPRATTAAEAPLSKPMPPTGAMARPPAPAASSVMPPKPVSTPAAPMSNIRGIATRPPAAAPIRPPTGPSTVPSSIPPKPVQPRPRPSTANVPPAQSTEAKPTTPSRPTPTAAKAPAQSNGKPSSPAPKGRNAPEKRTDTPPNGSKPEKQERNRSTKAERSESKPATPVTETEKKTSDEDTKGEKKPRIEDASTPATKKSLYLKGLPTPVTEEEIKALFPNSAAKIVSVKLLHDQYNNNKQKDFGYVDFANEDDCQEALKSHTDTIRDKTISISISNPPPRAPSLARGGRGGGVRGGRGGFRGSLMTGPGKKEGDSAGAATSDRKKEIATGGGGEKKD
ncbi:hypothetical protein BD324DRAFT_633119 [Kockovaella imperatae]|uniref:RRM domain-containing protein n=1 Tax=Kockovaella imperatae TaxID=4999 RepID=A0A1Y1UA41_9TREE|nr:hypothetical protein BD324DRAFT_633119 [Kockovaella imperatae]ORX34900.1 hypothetical protein BD324DRAFT_633119 [Kockovaella imperatae]